MEENKCKSMVTIPLQDYADMCKQIADLTEKLKEKTIVKYVSRWEDYTQLAGFIFIIAILCTLFFFALKIS